MQTFSTSGATGPEPAEVSQQEIEVILLRHLASYLSVPVFVADNRGNIIYFNEPAEIVVGRQFEGGDGLPFAVRFEAFNPQDIRGEPVSFDEMPMTVALREHRPVLKKMRLRGFDGSSHLFETTAFPLVGQAGRRLGAVSLLWEIAESREDETQL